MRNAQWFDIVTNAADVAEIYIYDTIGGNWDGTGVTCQSFVDALNAIKSKRISLRINSLGGSVYDGMAIYSALTAHPAHVTAVIDGIAASIASVVAMGADEVQMRPHSFLMIHRSRGGGFGTADDMRKLSAELARIDTAIAGIYASKTAGDESGLLSAMDAETWYTAEQAVEAKLADVVLQSAAATKPRAVAMADFSRFRRVPDAVRRLYLETNMATKSEATPTPAVVPAPTPTPAPAAAVGVCTLPDGSMENMDEAACMAAGGAFEPAAPATPTEEQPAAVPTAKPAARRVRAATIAELKAAIPSASSDFLIQCLEAGTSLGEARDLHMQALVARNDALSKRVDALEKRTAASGASAPAIATPAATGSTPATGDEATWRAEFADPKVAEEFRNDFATYKAYRKAQTENRIIGRISA